MESTQERKNNLGIKNFLSVPCITEKIVDDFLKIGNLSIFKNKIFNVGLSGGTTPLPFFDEIKKEKYKDKIDWKKVCLFWIDERCVGRNDSQNNYHNCYLRWLKFNSFVNSYRMEVWKDDCAVSYEKTIKKKLRLKNDKYIFDLLIMGVGIDGHVASIFNEEYKLQNRLVNFVKDKNGFDRYTVSLELLSNSNNTIIPLYDKAKIKMLKTIHNNDIVSPIIKLNKNSVNKIKFYINI